MRKGPITWEVLDEENAALRAEVERLREAIKWALTWTEGHPEWKWAQFEAELRRRVGEG